MEQQECGVNQIKNLCFIMVTLKVQLSFDSWYVYVYVYLTSLSTRLTGISGFSQPSITILSENN